jgi:hypothetical protein
MSTKTLLTTLGIIAVVVIIFFIVKSNDSTVDMDSSIIDSDTMMDETEQTPEDMVTEGETADSTEPEMNSENPENPGFPTTGFEPAE